MININQQSNIFINRILAEIEPQLLEEGQVLLGEVLEINQEEATIHLENLGRVRALLQGDLMIKVGDRINFLVKSVGTSQIHLKPLPETSGEILNSQENLATGKNEDKENMYLIKLLNDYGIRTDENSIEYVKTLIKYNIPLSEDKIVTGLQVMEKLEHLLDQLGEKAPSSKVFINIKEVGNLEKNDIRNILVENRPTKETGAINSPESESGPRGGTELERSIKFANSLEDFQLQIRQGDLSDRDIGRIIALLFKYNLKPSLGNIKSFFEFKDNVEDFYKDLYFHENPELFEFTNLNKNIIINSDSLKEVMEKNYLEYQKLISSLEELKDRGLPEGRGLSRKALENLQDKLEFLNELNQELNYIFIPLVIDDEHMHKAFIRLLKERKTSSNPKSNISILINLDTENLGSLMVNCQVMGDIININFHGLDQKDLPLFESREGLLKEYINYTGYRLGEINYIYEEEADILDILIVNQNPIYQLNIGV